VARPTRASSWRSGVRAPDRVLGLLRDGGGHGCRTGRSSAKGRALAHSPTNRGGSPRRRRGCMVAGSHPAAPLDRQPAYSARVRRGRSTHAARLTAFRRLSVLGRFAELGSARAASSSLGPSDRPASWSGAWGLRIRGAGSPVGRPRVSQGKSHASGCSTSLLASLDLTGIPVGSYRLAVRRVSAGGYWRCYAVVVR
jgi:hypothetical protein